MILDSGIMRGCKESKTWVEHLSREDFEVFAYPVEDF